MITQIGLSDGSIVLTDRPLIEVIGLWMSNSHEGFKVAAVGHLYPEGSSAALMLTWIRSEAVTFISEEVKP